MKKVVREIRKVVRETLGLVWTSAVLPRATSKQVREMKKLGKETSGQGSGILGLTCAGRNRLGKPFLWLEKSFF